MNQLPMTNDKLGQPVIETRALYIEEWLESLPYMNFKQTAQIIHTAIKATNDVVIKPKKRIELIGLYDGAYRYLLDNHLKVGEKHALETVETQQENLHLLKLIAASQARACRIAMEQTVSSHTTLWSKNSPPLEAVLSALNYLSHALLYSYMAYLPTPKNVWKELHYLYTFATNIKKQQIPLKEISEHKEMQETTIEEAYKRIILISMIDYHHFPFGAIWEIYQLLGNWSSLSTIQPYQDSKADDSLFVFDIHNDVKPVSLSRFNKKLAEGRELRILNARKVHEKVHEELKQLKNNQQFSGHSRLSPQYAHYVLMQITRYWGSSPKRYTNRIKSSGQIEIAVGINTSHYFLNNQQKFDNTTAKKNDDSIDVMEEVKEEKILNYETVTWQLINKSSGGMALGIDKKPIHVAKVGELITIKHQDENNTISWHLAAVRWLLIHYNNSYQMGIEILSKYPKPIAVKLEHQSEFMRGFSLNFSSNNGNFSIIASRGTYQNQQKLQVRIGEDTYDVIMKQLKENSILFEYFDVIPS